MRRPLLLTLPCLALLATGLASPEARAQDWEARRARMVEEQIRAQGIEHAATLRAMRAVPRHELVPAPVRERAYGDHPLPIGYGQTISQPYVVAYMTARLDPEPGMKVLEVGTGSGYQAAVLAETGAEVYSVEIYEALAVRARGDLHRLGYDVRVRHGDGFHGWAEHAPYDAVIVTAAAGHVPPPLVDQLRPGGTMVIPVGSVYGVQHLIEVEKLEDGSTRTETLLPVRFVPLVRGPR